MKNFDGFVVLSILGIFIGCATTANMDVLVKKAGSGDRAAVRSLIREYSKAEKEKKNEFITAIRGLGPVAEPVLLDGIYSPDLVERELCIGILGEIRSTKAVLSLIEYLGKEKELRPVAIWALGEIADPAALKTLIDILEKEPAHVKKAAVRSLVKLGKPSVAAVVGSLSNPDAEVRRFALRALNDLEDTAAADALIARLDTDADNEVVAIAAKTLAKTGTGKCVPHLIKLLGSRDPSIRVNCATALGILQAKAAEAPLRKTLDDPEVSVREWSARALENITGQRVYYKNSDGDIVLPYSLYR